MAPAVSCKDTWKAELCDPGWIESVPCLKRELARWAWSEDVLLCFTGEKHLFDPAKSPKPPRRPPSPTWDVNPLTFIEVAVCSCDRLLFLFLKFLMLLLLVQPAELLQKLWSASLYMAYSLSRVSSGNSTPHSCRFVHKGSSLSSRCWSNWGFGMTPVLSIHPVDLHVRIVEVHALHASWIWMLRSQPASTALKELNLGNTFVEQNRFSPSACMVFDYVITYHHLLILFLTHVLCVTHAAGVVNNFQLSVMCSK